MNNPSPSIQAERENVLTKNENNCQRCKIVSICGKKTHVIGESMKGRKTRGIIKICKIMNV